MAEIIERDREEGTVSRVVNDRKVLDPKSELAVQIPPEADGRNEDALAVAEEEPIEDVFARASEEAELAELEATEDAKDDSSNDE